MRLSPRHWLAGVTALGLASAFALGAPFSGAEAATTTEYLFATGAGAGGGPHVKVFKASNQAEAASFYAYGANFPGGVNVAMGDLNGDGRLEVITGAGAGGAAHVRAFSDRGAPMNAVNFYAYPQSFTGGVRVGVADVDGDGDDEILTAPGPGNVQPVIRVLDLNPETGVLSVEREFLAYATNWTGGVYVAGAFSDNTDQEGIVTGVGPGGGPHVRTFKFDGTPISSWYAYDPLYNGGVSVGSYYVDDNDDTSEIVTASLAGPGHIRGWNINGQFLSSNFYAYDAAGNSGALVSGALSGSSVGPFLTGGYRSGANVRGYTLQGASLFSISPYGVSYPFGVAVAASIGDFTDPIPTTTTSGPTTTTEPPTTTTSTSTTTTVPPTTTTVS